jgi:hypothetical protein
MISPFSPAAPDRKYYIPFSLVPICSNIFKESNSERSLEAVLLIVLDILYNNFASSLFLCPTARLIME